MKKDTLTAFLAGVAVTAAFFAGLGMARGGLDVQKVVLVDGQGQPLVGQGRFLPIGSAPGSSLEIRSSPFGLQVQGLK
jgi:S-adenosylhomocysteine hydrolase